MILLVDNECSDQTVRISQHSDIMLVFRRPLPF